VPFIRNLHIYILRCITIILYVKYLLVSRNVGSPTRISSIVICIYTVLIILSILCLKKMLLKKLRIFCKPLVFNLLAKGRKRFSPFELCMKVYIPDRGSFHFCPSFSPSM